MFAFPTQCRKGVDRLPYVDSTLKYKYNRRFPFFQPVETSVLFLSGGQFARERLYCQIENAPPWFARQKGYSVENFTILLKKYADFIVRVGVNPQPGQTLVINCCLEAAPLARLCVRSAYEAGARDVLVNWSDNDVSRSRMELGSEEALSDFKSWQLRRYLDYAESEGGVCVLHILADDPEVYAGLDGAKISRVNAGQRKFMAPWREYTMNDRVQWSIAAMPSAPWAKKNVPGAGRGCGHREALAAHFRCLPRDGRRPRQRVEGPPRPSDRPEGQDERPRPRERPFREQQRHGSDRRHRRQGHLGECRQR